MFKKIVIRNFKSLKTVNIELDQFNLIIGSNASGKSSFIEVFNFLRDVEIYGLSDAIERQGGVSYLFPINSKQGTILSIEVKLDVEGPRLTNKSKNISVQYVNPILKLKITKDSANTYKIKHDSLSYEVLCYSLLENDKKDKKIDDLDKPIGSSNLLFYSIEKDKKNREIKSKKTNIRAVNKKNENIIFNPLEIFPEFLMDNPIRDKDDLIINTYFSFLPLSDEYFTKIGVYNFDCIGAKQSTKFTTDNKLETNGSNLAVYLKSEMKDPKKKKKLQSLLADFLPFIQDISTHQLQDKSVLLVATESFHKKAKIPATFLSEGTINIINILTALYLNDDKSFLVFEEPEKNLHPKLSSKLISSFNDVASSKQVLMTTHNPVLVKECNIENILLVRRDHKGISTIQKAKDSKNLQEFLNNDIGIDEVFISNLF